MNILRTNILVPILSLCALSAGCASAPETHIAELTEATVLVSQADAAGAGQFAPGPLATARTELGLSQSLSEKGKTDQARAAAERSTANAKLALATTERAKAEKAARDSDAALSALRAETKRE